MFKASIFLLFCVLVSNDAVAHHTEKNMVFVSGGAYTPFYRDKKERTLSERGKTQGTVLVKSFFMDVYPVTNSDYREFVKKNPAWRRSKIKRVFADNHYLQNWKSDLQIPKKKMSNAPVTFVSWFAAKAFCASKGKDLPTVDQWEYAAYDNGRLEKETKERVLKWYSTPNLKSLAPIGSTEKNGFGVWDLQGLIWEWTYDFNGPIGSDSNAFCGNGAGGANNSSDYVSYMRFAFRGSLKAFYTTANLGFRCVRETIDE